MGVAMQAHAVACLDVPMKVKTPDAGDVVGGKYELVRLIGRGSMGEVWLAHHQSLREKVALKLLARPAWGDFEDATQAASRFRFEAQIAARLSRKTRHIVRVTDHGEEDDLAYLVMELLEGVTLETRLLRFESMAPVEAQKLVKQVARALEHAHGEGVLHRDLKPSNVFLTQDEDGESLYKVLDFGIARVIHAHLVMVNFSTAKGIVFGTPGYMSPEQARATAPLDPRCDLWGLATLAYEALTCELPVQGVEPDELLKNVCAGRTISVRERNPALPVALDAFFARAFAEHIDARYPSASELAAAFDHAIAGGAEPANVALAPTERVRAAQTLPLPDRKRASSSQPLVRENKTAHTSAAAAASHRRRRRTLTATVAGVALVTLAAAGIAWRSRASTPIALVAPSRTPATSEAPRVAPASAAVEPVGNAAVEPGSRAVAEPNASPIPPGQRGGVVATTNATATAATTASPTPPAAAPSTTKRLAPFPRIPEPNVSSTLPTVTTPMPKAKPQPVPTSKQVDKSEVL
jgi:eukaryotic-like serine/threonine-protein kinase